MRLLKEAAKKFGSRPAINGMTYRELDNLVDQTIIDDSPVVYYQNLVEYLAILRQGKAASACRGIKEADPGVTLLPTSGTTGEPKPITLHEESFIKNYQGLSQLISIKPSDRWLLNLPIHHVAGLAILYRCLLSGAEVVTENATIASFVPTQYYRGCPTGLHTILLGGGPVPDWMLEDPRVYESYGMTEMCSTVALNGVVLPTRKVKIVEGEIYVRGDEKPNWHRTGDLGEFIEGRLKILGRIDRRFVCGGENIQPEIIEKALLNLNGVTKAKVCPVEDPEWGMIAKATLKSPMSEEEIKSQLKERLAPFLIPKVFAFVD
ncbi:MAG: AMP-binding protein [Simkaniaceae bacterium]|nr:AMP-binding protein [Simkaniaceae bacterium]